MQSQRDSVKVFLKQAKSILASGNTLDNVNPTIVAGNESADLDSLTSSLLYAYLSSYNRSSGRDAKAAYIPITNIPAEDLDLRPEFTAILSHAGLKLDDLITLDGVRSSKLLDRSNTQLVLVDHNAPTGVLKERLAARLTGVIDHHEDEHAVPPSTDPRIINKSGSCTSLVVNHFRSAWDSLSSQALSSGAAHGQDDAFVGTDDAALVKHWDVQIAKLGMGSILIDTRNLEDTGKVTQHDEQAVQYLEAKILTAPGGADWSRAKFFEEIDAAKRDLDSLTVSDCLRKDYKMWTEEGANLGFSSVVKPIDWLISKAGSTEAFLEELGRFKEERELAVFVLMTTSTSSNGKFRRELLVWATGNTDVVTRAKAFGENAKSELGMEIWNGFSRNIDLTSDTVFRKVWEQTAVQHSRKRVAPLVREAIRG